MYENIYKHMYNQLYNDIKSDILASLPKNESTKKTNYSKGIQQNALIEIHTDDNSDDE